MTKWIWDRYMNKYWNSFYMEYGWPSKGDMYETPNGEIKVW